MTPFGIPIVIIVIAMGVALAAGLRAVSLVPTKSEVTKRLEEIEGMKWDSGATRRQAFDKLFNDKQRSSLQQSLFEAGWYKVSPGQMAARMIAGAVFGLTLGLCLLAYFKSFDMIFIGGVVLMTVIGAYWPMGQLKSAVKARKIEITKALPDLLDMLASTVQAGLAFNAALASSQETALGALGEEIKGVLSEVRMGRSRADALRSMAERVRLEQLTTTGTAIVPAERLGSNLANVLEELAEEVRNRRMIRAEEIANLMPTKMVIPMALFMLPALFVMI